MLLYLKWEIRPPFLVFTVILGFLSIFKKSQASSPFEALEWPNVRQATCLVWCGTGDCSRSSRGESGGISSWFGIHRTISHSFGDISVILNLCGCSLVLSAFPSSKYILVTSLIGSMQLLCTQCSWIGPCLSPRGKSHGFPRVAVGTWDIFSSYSGDGHSKLVFVQRCQNNCLFMMDTSGI